ncbi:WD40-repeat-containing domain protein [Naviculisporaceae sp. PSN 640]
MGNKRKRDTAAADAEAVEKSASTKKAKALNSKPQSTKPVAFQLTADGALTIQIIAGSYDRILHGVTAAISQSTLSSAKKSKQNDDRPTSPKAQFADTFLFNAHTSAIRCLALSPPSVPDHKGQQKILLATGSTDERINIYNISAHPPSTRAAEDQKTLSALTPRPVLENPKNREIGNLLHHTSNITRLVFPNRSKLLSAAEDSTIGVTRTRDWALLHSFKCPIPKVHGRPSGDTAVAGMAPSGVNDFAVHPSNKIMISVGKGERCMRLWNLETGKKSRVLNFDKEVLIEIGEGRHSTGEARRIVWGQSRDKDGEEEDEFAVGFERDGLVFGMDCRPRCRLMKGERTKVHEFAYVKGVDGENEGETVLAVSTEDGRILFFKTNEFVATEEDGGQNNGDKDRKETLPCARMVAQLGGKHAGITSRIKDFKVLPVRSEEGEMAWYIAAGSSDGRVRVWRLGSGDLTTAEGEKDGKVVGELLGTYETNNRITCLEAFVMIPRPEGAEDSEFEFESEESEDEDEDESE